MPQKEIDSLFKTAKSKVTVSKSVGVMGAFLSAGKQTVAKCEVCGNQCTAGSKLCKDHKSRANEIAQQKKVKLIDLRSQQDAINATCTTCQRYSGEILCVNLDCQTYFVRTRIDELHSRAEENTRTFYAAEKIAIDW